MQTVTQSQSVEEIELECGERDGAAGRGRHPPDHQPEDDLGKGERTGHRQRHKRDGRDDNEAKTATMAQDPTATPRWRPARAAIAHRS